MPFGAESMGVGGRIFISLGHLSPQSDWREISRVLVLNLSGKTTVLMAPPALTKAFALIEGLPRRGSVNLADAVRYIVYDVDDSIRIDADRHRVIEVGAQCRQAIPVVARQAAPGVGCDRPRRHLPNAEVRGVSDEGSPAFGYCYFLGKTQFR
jgi:hypothetical protein